VRSSQCPRKKKKKKQIRLEGRKSRKEKWNEGCGLPDDNLEDYWEMTLEGWGDM